MTSFEKVVVTGGAGLIGSHIVDLLIAGRDDGTYGDIVVFDDLTRGRRENLAAADAAGTFDLVEGDIRDVAAVDRVIDGADLVFHLAAIRITHCAEDPRYAHEVLGTGTFNVVDAASRAGARVVASSSASVYGLAEVFPTKEDHHPYDNQTIYGALKTYNEGLLRSYHAMQDLSYVALRYFNVYGPRMDVFGVYTEVLIRWMERIANGQPPLIFGDGTSTMDFVYATDIARANVMAAQATDVTDEVFNIASGTETSLNDLAAALTKVMGSDLAPEYGPERSVNAVPRRLADVSAAKERLGWTAEIDLEAGLTDLVEWWKSTTAAPSASSGDTAGETAGAAS